MRELAGTFISLMIANPSINWALNYSVDHKDFVFESDPIVKELEGISLTEATVLAYLLEQLETGVAEVPEPL